MFLSINQTIILVLNTKVVSFRSMMYYIEKKKPKIGQYINLFMIINRA